MKVIFACNSQNKQKSTKNKYKNLTMKSGSATESSSSRPSSLGTCSWKKDE